MDGSVWLTATKQQQNRIRHSQGGGVFLGLLIAVSVRSDREFAIPRNAMAQQQLARLAGWLAGALRIEKKTKHAPIAIHVCDRYLTGIYTRSLL